MNIDRSAWILGLFLGQLLAGVAGCGDDSEGAGGSGTTATGSTSSSSSVGMTGPAPLGEAQVYLVNATDAEITVAFDSVKKGLRVLPPRSAGWVRSPVFGDDGCIGNAPCISLGVEGISGLTGMFVDAQPGMHLIVPLHDAASGSFDRASIPTPGGDDATFAYEGSTRFGVRDAQSAFVAFDALSGKVDAAAEVFYEDPRGDLISLQVPTPFTAGARYYVRGTSVPDPTRLLICNLEDGVADAARCIDDVPVE